MLKILGNFYTNNIVNKKILKASLSSIKKAVNVTKQHQTEVDVSVCVCGWELIKECDFPQTKTFFKIGVHFGIFLQMVKNYFEHEQEVDVICFLEHDVLYPENYFLTVGDSFKKHKDVNCVSNMNYIGLNHTGWLNVSCRQEPMHQLSVSKKFFEESLMDYFKNFVKKGWINLEPVCEKSIIPFTGIMPSVHINHTKNFTSHYNCYEKTSFCETHPYWGHYSKYYPKNMRAVNCT